MKQMTNKTQGIISISSKGTGYVVIGADKDKKQDPEIDFRHLNTSLHGDLVEILLHPKNAGRQTAEVIKIIARAKTRFVGVLLNVFDAKKLERRVDQYDYISRRSKKHYGLGLRKIAVLLLVGNVKRAEFLAWQII